MKRVILSLAAAASLAIGGQVSAQAEPPTTPEAVAPNTQQPVTPQHQPQAQPPIQQPGTHQPGTHQPGTHQPGMQQHGYGQHQGQWSPNQPNYNGTVYGNGYNQGSVSYYGSGGYNNGSMGNYSGGGYNSGCCVQAQSVNNCCDPCSNRGRNRRFGGRWR